MTYVFDIDGTICHSIDGDYDNATPIQDRIDKINYLHEQGNKIIFQTARGMGRSKNSTAYAHTAFYEFTKNQLRKWGLDYHKLVMGKPSYDLFIDDRAINNEDWYKQEGLSV